MKITGLRMEHVLGVRNVEVSLPHAITLFCGRNDVGKTSLQEGIRLAFLGEAVRVQYKRDYNTMMRTGAKSGIVVVEFKHNGRSGRATATLPAFKQECNPSPPPQLPYVLDAPRFAALPIAERRKFLFDLFGVRANLQDVIERLTARGCPDDVIKIVTPILRQGFDAAQRYAEDQLQHWRATWKSITGEVYGEQKAETWQAPLAGAVGGNADKIKGIDSTITALEKEHAELQREIGAAKAYLKQHAEYAEKALVLKEHAEKMPALKREIDQTEKAIPAARTKRDQANEAVQRARLSGQPCPACGALLAVSDKGKLKEISDKKPKQLASLEAVAKEANAALDAMENSLVTLRTQLVEAMDAAGKLSALEGAMQNPTTPEALQELEVAAQGCATDLADLREKRRVLVESDRTAEEAREKTKNATEANRKYKEWAIARDLFMPSGIPGEILAETLGPVNARLKATAEFTKWPEPQLRGDMEILVNGLLYSLQGESVRWRVDAMIAEAIAAAAKLQLLVLDRIDVLHPEGRGELLDWCYHLVEAEGYESVMLFGTLKDKPKLDDANVFWLDAGRLG